MGRIAILLVLLLIGGSSQGTELPTQAAGALPPFHANGVVALLTDYGEVDFYVGALKGAVLSACAGARLVDLSHDVPPYDIALAAWQLWDSAREFPPGTVIVGIVDPGVGTGRRPIILETASGHCFVGPDNGLMTVVEREMGPGIYREITNRSWMRPGGISASFHGRDIFGPSAGRLACGLAFEEAGPVISDPVRLELPAPRIEQDSSGAKALIGQVLFSDHYGNLQTDISGALLDSLGVEPGGWIRAQVGARSEVVPYVHTYGDVAEGDLLLFVASTGRVELAVNQESAAERFGAESGAVVRLQRGRRGPR